MTPQLKTQPRHGRSHFGREREEAQRIAVAFAKGVHKLKVTLARILRGKAGAGIMEWREGLQDTKNAAAAELFRHRANQHACRRLKARCVSPFPT